MTRTNEMKDERDNTPAPETQSPVDQLPPGKLKVSGGQTYAPDRSAAIREALYDAIVDRRLVPGTKLVEDDVGNTFNASRTVVRAALQALAFDGVVTLERNRGAFVSRPTLEEARQVFVARRMIEPDLAAVAAEMVSEADLEDLRWHLKAEAEAIASRGPSARRAEIRISGELHLRIAAIARNDILSRFLRELVARSSLVIALYGRTTASTCARDEHTLIVEALVRRDGGMAHDLMQHHIEHIEADLDYQALETPSLGDLILRAEPAERAPAARSTGRKPPR